MKRIFKSGLFWGIVLTAFLFIIPAGASFLDEEAELTAKNTAEGIALEWTACDDVYYYEVYRQTSKNGEKVLLSKAQELSFVDTQTVDGKAYIYTVMPVLTDYSYSQQKTAVLAYRIGNVKITDACSEKKGLRIEWTAVKEAKGYHVLRKAEGDAEWTTAGKVTGDNTFYVDSNVKGDVKYTYSVKAVSGSFEGAVGDEVELQYIEYPELIGYVSTDEGIKLSWSKVPQAVYYVVYRKTNADSVWKPYALLDSDYTAYEDRDVKSAVSYSYIVTAVDESNKRSHYDDAVTMRFLKKPEIKTVSGATNGVKLTWTKSDGCEGYAVYRKDFGKSNWRTVCLVKGADTLSAVDSSAKNNTAYTYTVRAVWNKNLSTYDEKGATIRFMQAPQGLVCYPETEYGNVLKWNKNDSVQTFFVYRKADGGSWQLIDKTDKNIYADKKADKEGKYYYSVKGYASSVFYSGAAESVKTFKDEPILTGKMVALTFDDGPSDSITNGVLDVLEEYGVKATFFVVGQNIYYGNEALTRAAKMGCEIGTHTYSHIDLPSSSSSLIREEIEDTDELIKKYTGAPSTVARAPGGALDSASAAIVNKPFFYWTVDTRDWESRDADSVISIVKNNTGDGSIILMHDIYESTLEAVETVVPWLIDEGYQLVTVTELMQYKGNITPEPGVQYYDGFGN